MRKSNFQAILLAIHFGSILLLFGDPSPGMDSVDYFKGKGLVFDKKLQN